MIRILALTTITTLTAWAQIERPQVAWLLDTEGALRPLVGTAATSMVGDPVVSSGVLSLACFPEVCFAKTDSAVYSSLGEAAAAPEGPALFARHDSVTYVYFSATQQMARWTGKELVYLPFDSGGEILSILATQEGFDYAVAKDNVTWIEHYSEADHAVTVTAALGVTGAVHLLEQSRESHLALVATLEGLRLMKATPNEDPRIQDLDISGTGSFVQVGGGYIQINTQTGMWLLKVESVCPSTDCEKLAQVQLLALPPIPPPPPSEQAGGSQATNAETPETQSMEAQSKTVEPTANGYGSSGEVLP